MNRIIIVKDALAVQKQSITVYVLMRGKKLFSLQYTIKWNCILAVLKYAIYVHQMYSSIKWSTVVRSALLSYRLLYSYMFVFISQAANDHNSKSSFRFSSTLLVVWLYLSIPEPRASRETLERLQL